MLSPAPSMRCVGRFACLARLFEFDDLVEDGGEQAQPRCAQHAQSISDLAEPQQPIIVRVPIVLWRIELGDLLGRGRGIDERLSHVSDRTIRVWRLAPLGNHRGPQARSAARGLPTYLATRKTRPRRSLFVLGASGSVRVGVRRGLPGVARVCARVGRVGNSRWRSIKVVSRCTSRNTTRIPFAASPMREQYSFRNLVLCRIRMPRLCGWLARNSIDGGRIIYLLDRKVLNNLRFASFTFENNPQGKFMLSITFGYSKYYVDSLSENVSNCRCT